MAATLQRKCSGGSYFCNNYKDYYKFYPPAQNQYMQEKNLGELNFREYMRGLYSHSREYRKIFLRSHVLHISQILEGIYFGAYTCRACIRTRANTGKYSWGIIYVLVSCQRVVAPRNYFAIISASMVDFFGVSLRIDTCDDNCCHCNLRLWCAQVRCVPLFPDMP